jgi:MFS family permease
MPSTAASARARSDTTRAMFARIFLPFAAGYFLSYLYRSVNALIGGDLARDLDLGASELGLLTAAYFFAFGAFQLPLGLLLDRYPPARINAALLVFAGAGAALFALAQDVAGLTLGRALIGLGVSACLMSAMKAFVLWFPMDRLASLNGWMLASGGLGAMTASAPVEAMLEITGWRGVFFILSAASFVAAAAILLVVPDRKAEGEPETLARMISGYARIFSNARFWRIALVAMTVQAGFLAVQGLWVGAWFSDVGGLARAALSMRLLALAVATTVGFAFFGWFSDRLAARGVPPLTVFKIGALLAAAALAVIAFVPALAGLAAWLAFNLFSASAPIGYAILSREFPRELAGRVNTAVNLLIFAAAFSIQWGLGAIVGLWERIAGHYPPAAYAAALGALLVLQVVALAGVATLRSRV